MSCFTRRGERGAKEHTLLERLLDLLEVGQVADVAGDALGGGAEGGEGVGYAQVDLAGVGLRGDGVDVAEAGFLGVC